MLKAGIIGLGKMGISHAAILGAHPYVNVTAVCDTSKIVLSGFRKYSQSHTYSDYRRMMDQEDLDFIVIATPTKMHYPMVKAALQSDLDVFCEKPFSLYLHEGKEMVSLAANRKLANQVGYHNQFVGTFRELSRLLQAGLLGDLVHFTGEAHGPVVVQKKNTTWRSKKSDGGGCLMDYASHVLNLVQVILGTPVHVHGALIKQIFSQEVDDAVYALLSLDNGLSGNIMVNWSDDTYRKMSTSLTIQGTNGKIICDATELKIYLKKGDKEEKLPKGWSTKYITDLSLPVNYYLRGEEYSAQIDHFVMHVANDTVNTINTFEQAYATDQIIHQILASQESKIF